jgi:hypothetical protein
MKKVLITLVTGTSFAFAAIASPSPVQARWRHPFPVAPVVGGLAAGALIGATLAAPRPYYVYEPVFYGPHCIVRRERIWDGWAWRFRSVEDCY